MTTNYEYENTDLPDWLSKVRKIIQGDTVMSNKNYDSGAAKERDLQKLFSDDTDEMNRDAFALETVRSAGSKGLFDVVILTPTGVRFIQVKKIEKGNNWRSEYKTEVEAIQELPRAGDNISYEYWVWENYNGWIYREVVQ